MQARSAYCTKLYWVLASVAALGCGGDQGPSPTVRLSIQGQVLSADPTPVAVAGATVALRTFLGFLGEGAQILAHTTTGQTGNYHLTYESICGSLGLDNNDPQDWIEASATGYQTASTFSTNSSIWPSDPPIHCTTDPQVINLSLQPFGTLHVITNTTGSGLDPDGYLVIVGGMIPNSGTMLGYRMGLNDEKILSQALPGQHSLELTEVASICTVAGDNPRTVIVAARETTVATFQVTCAS